MILQLLGGTAFSDFTWPFKANLVEQLLVFARVRTITSAGRAGESARRKSTGEISRGMRTSRRA